MQDNSSIQTSIVEKQMVVVIQKSERKQKQEKEQN